MLGIELPEEIDFKITKTEPAIKENMYLENNYIPFYLAIFSCNDKKTVLKLFRKVGEEESIWKEKRKIKEYFT